MRDQARFEVFRDELRSAFPTWTRIRKDPNSMGSQFLQVTGKRLADVEWVLEYALRQQYIGTADLEQADIMYIAHLPGNIHKDLNIRFSSGEHVYDNHQDMIQFLESPQIIGRYSSITYNTKCHVDYTKKKLYVHRVYNRDETYRHGSLKMTVLDTYGATITESIIPFYTHHVWNFFDEFGLLLGLSRLEGEKNYEFRERILDVFRRPAGPHKVGLINGMGRELGLTYEMKWDDGGEDIVLDRSRVLLETISVDTTWWPDSELYKDKTGRIVLQGHPDFKGQTRTIRFIAGVELHELHDTSDQAFQNELRNVDGTATPLLQYYVEQIKDRVPIMWGRWKWNQGFWDVTDADMSGYGYIPNVYDATFSGWKGYTSKEE